MLPFFCSQRLFLVQVIKRIRHHKILCVQSEDSTLFCTYKATSESSCIYIEGVVGLSLPFTATNSSDLAAWARFGTSTSTLFEARLLVQYAVCFGVCSLILLGCYSNVHGTTHEDPMFQYAPI